MNAFAERCEKEDEEDRLFLFRKSFSSQRGNSFALIVRLFLGKKSS
jgi:hypothetical protein